MLFRVLNRDRTKPSDVQFSTGKNSCQLNRYNMQQTHEFISFHPVDNRKCENSAIYLLLLRYRWSHGAEFDNSPVYNSIRLVVH